MYMLQSQGLLHDTYVYGRSILICVYLSRNADGALSAGVCFCLHKYFIYRLNNPVIWNYIIETARYKFYWRYNYK